VIRVGLSTLALWALVFLLHGKTAARLLPLVAEADDVLLAADTRKGLDAIAHPSDAAISDKHPLHPPLMGGLVEVTRAVFDLDFREAVTTSLALVAATITALVFLTLLAIGAGGPGNASVPMNAATACGLALVHALFNANLVYFSIPDTYGLSAAFVALFFLLLARLGSAPSVKRMTGLGLLGGTAALVNAPLLGLLLPLFVHLALARGVRRASKHVLPAALAAVFLFTGTHLALHGTGFLHKFAGLSRLYGDLSHFVQPAAVADGLAGFLLLSVVSPLTTLPEPGSMLSASALPLYAGNPLGAAALALHLAALVAAAIVFMRRRAPPLCVAALSWILLLLVFYVWYHPPEALLFSPQITGPLVLVTASAVATRRTIVQGVWLFAQIPLLAWVNLSAILT